MSQLIMRCMEYKYITRKRTLNKDNSILFLGHNCGPAVSERKTDKEREQKKIIHRYSGDQPLLWYTL
jgi:hypothetical protein